MKGRDERLLPSRRGAIPGRSSRKRSSSRSAIADGLSAPSARQRARARGEARQAVSRSGRHPGDVLFEPESRRRSDGPLDEQRDGFVVEQLVRRERLLGIRDVERRDSKDHLSCHAQRLAARRENGEPRRRAQERSTSAAAAASTCSQLSNDEQQLARREEVDHSVDDLLRRAARGRRARRRQRPARAADR